MQRNDSVVSTQRQGNDELVRILHDHDCMLSDRHISEINNLSLKRRTRLRHIALRLIEHKMLSIETFSEALRRVSLHVASVEMSQVKKEKYEESSRLTLDSGLTFYLDRKSAPTIRLDQRNYKESMRLGFEDPKKTKVRWAIKIPGSGFRDVNRAVAAAKKEVKYNRLMGRQSFFYSQNSKVRLGNEWLAGESLWLLRDDIAKLSLIDRLKLLTSIVAEINKLHLSLLVHYDIHVGNIIREPQNYDVQLIDLELSHKANSPDDFEVDIKDIHYVIKDLLFADIYRKQEPELRLNEKAIMLLDHALKEKGSSMKCTSQQALNYCNLLLEKFDSLSETRLQDILNSTLNRGTFDVEDVMRGSERPSMFAKI